MYELRDFQIIPIGEFPAFDFRMFNYVPETPNDAYQFSTQEKVRAFNNSCLILYEFYSFIYENFATINKEAWDSANNRRLRQLFGMMYKELFIYQEKIVKFVFDLLHIQKKTDSTAQTISEIDKYSKNFDFIKQFVEKCNNINKNKNYIEFRAIRADEVHNINQWDIVNYDLVDKGNGATFLPISYKHESSYFYNNLMNTIDVLIELKKFVESFVTWKNTWSINSICTIQKPSP